MEPKARLLLLRTAAIFVAGQVSESVIDGGLQAIKHHTGPLTDPCAYFYTVLQDKTGGTFAALLDDLPPVPDDLVAAAPKPDRKSP